LVEGVRPGHAARLHQLPVGGEHLGLALQAHERGSAHLGADLSRAGEEVGQRLQRPSKRGREEDPRSGKDS
jgi:hypothetical protein